MQLKEKGIFILHDLAFHYRKKNFSEIINYFLKFGYNINDKDELKNTILHEAANSGAHL